MTAALDIIARRGRDAWKPPQFIPLSEWADRYAYLSEESSAVVGKFHCLPYQREIMDAFTDRKVEEITLMKSARVGGTKIIDFAIAYRIHQNPRSMLVVQPTLGTAKRFSKIELKPMFRDTPVLHGKISKEKSRDAGNTILEKDYIGGTIFIVGANSAAGLSSITVGDVFLDEEDRYEVEADNEGDPIKLAIVRTVTYPNRKIFHNSSPGDKATGHIEKSFLEGDQRRYCVPCPHCGSMRPLQFRAKSGEEHGHTMEWPEGNPDGVFFRCAECHEEIHEKSKRWMIENGKWVAKMPFRGHASFHIWAAYSYAPNATWAHIANAFVDAKGDQFKLKVFVNTTLGETWASQGDAPDWHRLYERREDYPRCHVPARARCITAAADVHPDRIEVEVMAWGPGMENWSIDYRTFWGETDNIASPIWRELDAMLIEQFQSESGRVFTIAKFGIDCGFRTQVVTKWVERYRSSRVVAVKGSDQERQVIGAPSYTETTLGGKVIKGSVRHYPIGVGIIKSEIYGWLRLPAPTEENPTIPIGYSHFSVNVNNEEYFKQLTAERLEITEMKSGRRKYAWVKDYKRNEALDVHVYNRALAFQLGVDRWKTENDALPQSANKAKSATAAAQNLSHPQMSPQMPRRRPSLRDRRPRRLW